jgi:pentatricopeptide repeat protein
MASTSKLHRPDQFLASPYRRPLLLLFVALLILALALVSRLLFPSTAPATALVAPAPLERASTAALDRLQRQLRANPEDVNAYAQLGLGLLQQVRESGDMSLYSRAGAAFDEALRRDPWQVDALMGQGVLALALHDFQGAIAWAEKAQAINPFRAGILGIMVDGYVELGRYEEAVTTLQAMVDLRPDLHSYSRISYLRELHGDVDGAIAAMRTAATSVATNTEEWRWTMTHLGHLYFNQGDLAQATAIYQEVLAARVDYPYALEGMARVAAAQGQTATALAQYQTLAERLPLPQFVIALGELHEAIGDMAAAQAQYDLVAVMQQLNAAAGMNVDLEMALFNATHGTDQAALVAEVRAAYTARPTIYAADALAWALYQQGEYAEAWQRSQEALRLGTQDATLHFHAGMIALEQGDKAAARSHLTQALAINPYFSPLQVPVAKARLAGL